MKKERSIQSGCDNSWIYEEIVGSSRALREALAHVPAVARTDCTVLITGESGTGKGLVARAIHELSQRPLRAFAHMNCAAVPPSRIASELFGRQKGSWSTWTQPRSGGLQMAAGGTIFLEGIENLSAQAQAALLLCLQEMELESAEGKLDVRLIAASTHDLRAAMEAGNFPRELYYRLNVFPIHIPSLRERKEDIPALARYFLNCHGKNVEKKMRGLGRPALEILQSYPWPGNMRELERVMERFAKLWSGESFSVDAKWISRGSISAQTLDGTISSVSLPNKTELLEAALMEMLAELPGWETGVS